MPCIAVISTISAFAQVKGIQVIAHTFMSALESLGHMGLILLLIIFIFAVLGAYLPYKGDNMTPSTHAFFIFHFSSKIPGGR